MPLEPKDNPDSIFHSFASVQANEYDAQEALVLVNRELDRMAGGTLPEAVIHAGESLSRDASKMIRDESTHITLRSDTSDYHVLLDLWARESFSRALIRFTPTVNDHDTMED